MTEGTYMHPSCPWPVEASQSVSNATPSVQAQGRPLKQGRLPVAVTPFGLSLIQLTLPPYQALLM